MATEIWRPVPGHPGYEVSNQGQVKTSDLFDAAGRLTIKGVPVAQCLGGSPRYHPTRYWEVSLRRPGDTAAPPARPGHTPRKVRKVHHLVAEAFIGPRPDGLMVCHNDGDPHNNNVENLRYDTQASNIADMWRHRGGHHQSRKTHCLNGHELTSENCYASTLKQGHRKCKTCQRARTRARLNGTSVAEELARQPGSRSAREG